MREEFEKWFRGVHNNPGPWRMPSLRRNSFDLYDDSVQAQWVAFAAGAELYEAKIATSEARERVLLDAISSISEDDDPRDSEEDGLSKYAKACGIAREALTKYAQLKEAGE